jgi:CRP-like cAMP-binding protein
MLTDKHILDDLRRHPLFGKLPAEAFEEVCNRAIWRKLDSSSVVFHQGEPAERFYFLLEGQVTLTRVLPEGVEKLVEVIHPGQSFAEALLFSGVPCYPVTANAQRQGSLVSIDGGHYRKLLEQQPKICLDLLASFSVRLHQRLNEMDTLSLANASQRVVRYLNQEQSGDSGEIQLCVPKRMIASQLGIQPETFSRILHRLIDAGLIAMDRRNIRILDNRNLLNFCH